MEPEQWKSHERGYTLTDSTFIKSELPEEELPTSQATGRKVYPLLSRERLQNEAATIQFIASKTTIPVPEFLDLNEKNGLLRLEMKRAPGVPLDSLKSDIAVTSVTRSLESYILPQLRELQHHTTGSVDSTLPLILPSRITCQVEWRDWRRKTTSSNDGFPFCHNDLAPHNIFVDPVTFQITAIIDWEFAGFFPAKFEYPFWSKPYNEQEHLQVDDLIEFLNDPSKNPKDPDTDKLILNIGRFASPLSA